MDEAKATRRKIMEWMEAVDAQKASANVESHNVRETIKHFSESMDSDLNVSAAIADIFSAMHSFHKNKEVSIDDLKAYKEFVALIRGTFGCFDAEVQQALPAAVEKLLSDRATARANKNFTESDRLRDEMKKLGYEVRDSGGEQTVKKI
jgi:cysteinyl-tRNA synthetase